MARTVDANVKIDVKVPIDVAWSRFVPIDLTRLFRGKGPLPAVVRTFDQTGPWDVLGQTRRVELSDGQCLTEQVLTVSPPEKGQASFGYRVFGYSGFIGSMTNEALGNWSFRQNGPATTVHWCYSFRPRNAFVALPLRAVIGLIWSRYMADAIRNTRDILEKLETVGTTT